MTATTEVTRPLPQTQTVVAKRRRVRIYQHSDLLYWWVVWLYGFICAGLTYLRGNKVDFEAHAVFVHPSPWIGISMIGLILFVTIFTNERARGVYSLVLALFFALVVGGVQMTYGWEQIFPLFQLLQVHANLAFYLTLSVPLFVVWVVVILGLDRLNYWYFEPGEVGQRNVVGEGSDYYVPQNVRIHKLPYDLFVNRILGLWFVGFGTGDMEVLVSSPDGQRHFTLRNIWRVGRRDDEIRELIGAKQFMQSGKG